MQHWIEFLPEARALLAIIILSARAILVIGALHPPAPISTTQLDAATPAPAPAAPTTAGPTLRGDSRSMPSDRVSRSTRVVLQLAQITAAGLALLDWLNKLDLM